MHRPIAALIAFLWAAALVAVGSPAAAPPAAGDPCRPTGNTLAAVECAGIPAVASLQPRATDERWKQLVRSPRPSAAPATPDCRPLRAVFYTATDWLRLATTLAADASPCADYYISIPPLAADKTQERPNQAWRIRALGADFHAMAEINMNAWAAWVTDNGATWYQAGVEARRRMAAAGYDVSLGDTWAVNELSSAVRQGSGAARAHARDFVHGLFDGDGTAPTARGAVFIVGIGQGTTNLSTYKTNLETWFQDTAFWNDMSAYVSDWSQEVYGDFRNYGVAGSSLSTRRDYLNDFLQHVAVLSAAGPDSIATARSYVGTAYSPLANAAWQWDFGFGWTQISSEQMENYVSAQTYALRYFSGTIGREDHWGFAWAPRNASGIPSSDFATQTGQILDRLAAAIYDSAQTFDPHDPGIGACGTPGQNVWCGGEIDGASFNDAWKTFEFWTQPALVFATAPQTLTAGTPSAPMAVQLQANGTAQNAPSPVTVDLTSSSAQGLFSTSRNGPWTSTLSVTIPTGGSTSASFYYEDTQPGNPVLTASASAVDSGTQTETVVSGPTVGVSSIAYKGGRGPTLAVTLAVADDEGNPIQGASVSISLTRNGSPDYSATASTRPNGKVTFETANAAGCYTTKVTNVTASGYIWNGATPPNEYGTC